MDAAKFCDSKFGYATKKPGDKWAFVYYLPRHIPRDLELSTGVWVATPNNADSVSPYMAKHLIEHRIVAGLNGLTA